MQGHQFGKRLEVLIAEDNFSNQLLMKMYVKSFGGVPFVVENGEEAINEFIKGKYDLILMDLSMPVLDGIKATAKIREYNTEVPIIAVTVHEDDNVKQQSMQAGINCYIEKPYYRKDLFTAIEDCISKS